MKRTDFSLSDACMIEAQTITKGFHESWTMPEKPKTIFDKLKPYAVPYDFDFNDNGVQMKNKKNRE